jgi:DNA invertase Pin-like site-specific DNA recombinase
MSAQVGYLRVSSLLQNTARQLDGVLLDQVFEEKASGKDTHRPQWKAYLAYLRAGDTLDVHAMDRLARNLDDLRGIVKELTDQGRTVSGERQRVTHLLGHALTPAVEQQLEALLTADEGVFRISASP